MTSRMVLGAAAVLAACTFVAPAAAQAARYQIPLADFGYAQAVQENGPNAVLSLYIPVRPNLRTLHIHVPLAISPQVDRRSSIDILADGVPIRTISVQSAGLTPTLDVDLPVPAAPARSVTISIAGHLFINGNVCSPPPSADLWFTVRPGANVAISTAPSSKDEQVSDFLAGYGGTYSVVARGNGDDVRAATLQLAYQLHQVQHWRHVTVVRNASGPGVRTVVVGAFPSDASVHGDELDLTPNGVALITPDLERIMLSPALSGTTDDAGTAARHELSIADLGVAADTQRGTGELPFDIPVTYGAFGGIPEHLRLHVDLTHTPIDTGDRAFVQVLVNGTLIGSYDMHRNSDPEIFDVPLDVQALSSASVVRVVPTFFYQRDACKGNYPAFTTTLMPATKFQWDGIGREALSVGEFTRAMSGKVVVLVDADRNDPAAFKLLSMLGTVNAATRSIDVQRFTGTIPSGYDYAVVVAGGDQIGQLSAPLRVDSGHFTIFAADGRTVRYHADYSAPFGVLETTRIGGTPTLIATYWKDSAALDGIARLSPDEVATQTDSVLVFNRNTATYTDTTPRPAAAPNGIIAWMPWLFGTFAIALVGIVTVASRRKV